MNDASWHSGKLFYYRLLPTSELAWTQSYRFALNVRLAQCSILKSRPVPHFTSYQRTHTVKAPLIIVILDDHKQTRINRYHIFCENRTTSQFDGMIFFCTTSRFDYINLYAVFKTIRLDCINLCVVFKTIRGSFVGRKPRRERCHWPTTKRPTRRTTPHSQSLRHEPRDWCRSFAARKVLPSTCAVQAYKYRYFFILSEYGENTALDSTNVLTLATQSHLPLQRRYAFLLMYSLSIFGSWEVIPPVC